MSNLFYKYRPLGTKKHLERILEIIWKEELHASNFTRFNDINEGLYYVKNFDEKQATNIYKQKSGKNICSFSNKDEINFQDDMLMWAHYGNSNIGVRIEFALKNQESLYIKPIRYGTHLAFEDIKTISSQDIEQILTTKHKMWEYEREYRVFTKNNKVDIEIKNIVLGLGLYNNKSRVTGEQMKFDIKYKAEILSIVSLSKLKNIDVYKYKIFYYDEQNFTTNAYLEKIEKVDDIDFNTKDRNL